jgi:hypothetical protein
MEMVTPWDSSRSWRRVEAQTQLSSASDELCPTSRDNHVRTVISEIPCSDVSFGVVYKGGLVFWGIGRIAPKIAL